MPFLVEAWTEKLSQDITSFLTQANKNISFFHLPKEASNGNDAFENIFVYDKTVMPEVTIKEMMYWALLKQEANTEKREITESVNGFADFFIICYPALTKDIQILFLIFSIVFSGSSVSSFVFNLIISKNFKLTLSSL